MVALLLALGGFMAVGLPTARVARATTLPDDQGYVSLPTHQCTLTDGTQATCDPYEFVMRQCVSYVAYRLQHPDPPAQTVTFRGQPFKDGWGKGRSGTTTIWDIASKWAAYALDIGFAVDDHPAKGAVAWWSANKSTQGFQAGAQGHVAYVTNVNTDGTVTIEDYNGSGGSLQHGTASGVKAEHYIHLERNLPGGVWTGASQADNQSASAGGHLQLSAHVDSNGNDGGGGTSTVTFTAYASTDTSWHAIHSPLSFNTSVDLLPISYTVPAGADFVWVSFDVTSTMRYPDGSSSTTFQLAPQGVHKYCINASNCPTYIAAAMPGPFYQIDGPLMGGGSVGGGQQPCAPATNQIGLFTGTNYTGQCVVRGIGQYPDPASIGLPNDSISSVQIGGGINVELCRDSNFSNTCEWTTSSIPDLSTHSVGAQQVSSVSVVGGYAQSGGCSPNASEVALFVGTSYGGQCVVKEIGSYPDPGSMGIPNDSTSSVLVGSNVKVELCRDNGFSNTCEWIDQNVPDLGTHSVGSQQASSAQVILRGGISLCDGTNYSGSCQLFSDGTTNLSDSGWANRARSVLFSSAYANHYHIVLWTGPNQTGSPYHADNSVPDLGNPYDGNIQSINIYPHRPPSAPSAPLPASGKILPHSTTAVTLSWSGADQNQLHVWGPGYNLVQGWMSSSTLNITGLQPGRYYWQVQSQNDMGPGPWSDIWTFDVAVNPQVADGSMTLLESQPGTLTVFAYDLDQQALTLSASGLPAFASFHDDGDSTGTLTVSPPAGSGGTYTITVQASDGTLTGTGTVVVSVVPSQDCPAGWTCADVNNPSTAGGESLTGTSWVVEGSGGDIWGTADQFHSVFQSMPADGTVAARVTSQAGGDGWAKAGIMLRQSADPGAAYYALEITPSNGVVVQYRAGQGASASMAAQVSGGVPAYFLIARAGVTFSAYTSSDGTGWTALPGSSVSLAVSGSMLAGLVVASHAPGLSTVGFDSVSVTPGATPPSGCPAGWACGDIGSPDVAGSQSAYNGAWNVQGYGSDIWGTADQFHFAWQGLGGDGSLSAHIGSQGNTDGWAKAGVMLRQDAGAASAFYALLVTPGNGIVVQYRTSRGAGASMAAQIPGAAPIYLRVTRSGATFTATTSSDGTTWTPVAESSVTLGVSGPMVAGLAVASHAASTSTVVFDRVIVSGASGFDFEDGTTDGWSVGWGNTVTMANRPGTAFSGARALGIDVQGATSWPAIDEQSGLTGLAPGATITFHIYSPVDGPVTIVPYARDGGWNVHFGSSNGLVAGWNAISWQLPAMTGLQSVGFQINSDHAWSGSLALDSVSWVSRYDFEDGTTDGWSVGWGITVAVSTQASVAFAGTHSLRVDLQGVTSWPAIDVQTGLTGLGPGSTVTFQVYSPVDHPVTIVPYVRDGSWSVLFGPPSGVVAGWNTISWQLPAMTGLNSMGLQINNDGAWAGSLAVDAVSG